jgi:hypothetical protein
MEPASSKKLSFKRLFFCYGFQVGGACPKWDIQLGVKKMKVVQPVYGIGFSVHAPFPNKECCVFLTKRVGFFSTITKETSSRMVTFT